MSSSSASSDDNEASIGSVYCVVYRLLSGNWEVEGSGWSHLHAFSDMTDGSHRLVGWTVEECALVINVNLTADCSYRRKSDDFHKLRDEDGQHWGFGFYSKEDSTRQAVKFMRLVQQVIRQPLSTATPSALPSSSPASQLSPASSSPRSQSARSAHPSVPSSAVLYPVASPSDIKHSFPPPMPSAARPTSRPASSSPQAQLIAQAQRAGIVVSAVLHPPATSSPPPSVSPAAAAGNATQLYRSNGTEPSSVSSPLARASSIPLPAPARPPPHLTRPQSAKQAQSTRPRMGSSGDGSAHAPLRLPYSSINHSNSYVGPAGASKTRASPPPLITLGMGLKPAPVSVSPSSAPPTVAVSPTSSPPKSPCAVPRHAASVPAADSQPSSTSSSPQSKSPPAAACTPSPTQSPNPVTSPPPAVPTRPSRKDSAALLSPALHRETSKLVDDLYDHPIPMGSLTILPPKQSKSSSSSSSPTHRNITSPFGPLSSPGSAGHSISEPHTVTHTVHVKYDPVTRTYAGLPAEFEAAMHQQFGLPAAALDRVKLPDYSARIPAVLVQLKEYLVQHGGLEVEGIFRVAADGEEVVQVKRAINEGRWSGCRDIHVVAQLIKVWWREVPPPRLLDDLDAASIAVDSQDSAGAVVQRMAEPGLSLLLWLLDLCAAVCGHSSVNKMSSKALGIVISPNLFTPAVDEPLAALMHSQKVAVFLQRAIEWRMAQQHDAAHTV